MNQIQKPLYIAKIVLFIGIPFCLLTPILFTQDWGLLDFTNTGNIGDTIGGITAPFTNILAAILVFLAFRAQISANLSLQEQIEQQNLEKKNEIERLQISQLYENVTIMQMKKK